MIYFNIIYFQFQVLNKITKIDFIKNNNTDVYEISVVFHYA